MRILGHHRDSSDLGVVLCLPLLLLVGGPTRATMLYHSSVDPITRRLPPGSLYLSQMAVASSSPQLKGTIDQGTMQRWDRLFPDELGRPGQGAYARVIEALSDSAAEATAAKERNVLYRRVVNVVIDTVNGAVPSVGLVGAIVGGSLSALKEGAAVHFQAENDKIDESLITRTKDELADLLERGGPQLETIDRLSRELRDLPRSIDGAGNPMRLEKVKELVKVYHQAGIVDPSVNVADACLHPGLGQRHRLRRRRRRHRRYRA